MLKININSTAKEFFILEIYGVIRCMILQVLTRILLHFITITSNYLHSNIE